MPVKTKRIRALEEIRKVSEIVLRIDPKICLCADCAGSGRKIEEVCTSYHRGEYESVDVGICPCCNGSGLVEERTLVKEVKVPYGEVLKDTIPYSPKILDK